MISFAVYGSPAPQGSKSFKGLSRKTGRAILAESSKKVAPWRMDVKATAERLIRQHNEGCAQPWTPMDGPLVAVMVFTLPKPKSAPKTRQTWPDRKPDLSKLIRSTEDALTDAGLIADDARIVAFARAAKVYPGEDLNALSSPGAWIELRRLEAAA